MNSAVASALLWVAFFALDIVAMMAGPVAWIVAYVAFGVAGLVWLKADSRIGRVSVPVWLSALTLLLPALGLMVYAVGYRFQTDKTVAAKLILGAVVAGGLGQVLVGGA